MSQDCPISSWVAECDNLLLQMLPLHAPIARYPAFDPNERRTIGALSTACISTSGSALILIENGRLWDAEILTRSVVEGSLKFSYLLCSPPHFRQRYAEYAVGLYEIGLLKNHLKAQACIDAAEFIGKEEHQAIKDLLLSEDEFTILQSKYPSRVRSELEKKWGFGGLVEALAQEKDIPNAEGFKGLAHNYSMSSRVLHADWFGVHMMIERDSREEPSRTATNISHVARMISDIFWFSILRLKSGYKLAGKDFTPTYEDLLMRFQPLQSELDEALSTWDDIEYPTSA